MLPAFIFGSKTQKDRPSLASVITEYGSVCWNRMWPYVNTVFACIRDKVFTKFDNDLEDWVFVPAAGTHLSGSWTDVSGWEGQGQLGNRGKTETMSILGYKDRPMVDVDLSGSPKYQMDFD